MQTATTERIRVVGLTKRFRRRSGGGTVVPVDNVSLSVSDREMVVLLGASGCGKTTLLRCIAGLERPDAGQIFIDGALVFDSEKDVFVPPEKRSVSMVFQNYALWPHMTIFENVAYPLECRGVSASERRTRVLDAIEIVGLSGLEKQYPNQLSGGQQQRVALARAIGSRTSTIFFDEPLSNVDAKVREQLRAEIQQLQATLGFTGLYVTHDQVEAMALANRIALLNSGRVEQIGSGHDLYWRPSTEYVANFIGTANLWKGVVVANGSAQLTVRTAFGEVIVAAAEGDARHLLDDPVTILARPEVIQFDESEALQSLNAFPCTIKSRQFLGQNVEFDIDVGSENIRVSATPLSIMPTGQHAWMKVLPSHLILLPG